MATPTPTKSDNQKVLGEYISKARTLRLTPAEAAAMRKMGPKEAFEFRQKLAKERAK